METQTPSQTAALRYIRMKETCNKTGLSKSTIYDRIKAGSFPQPVRLGARVVAFVESEVDAWMSAALASRNALTTGNREALQ